MSRKKEKVTKGTMFIIPHKAQKSSGDRARRRGRGRVPPTGASSPVIGTR